MRGAPPYRLPEEVAKGVFRQIVQGVCYMHEHGLVHRDLSLENVVLAEDGEGGLTARIIDFGAAWAMPLPEHGPAPRVRVGKFGYFPPEVYHREDIADARVMDAWTLGVMLFGMLHGALLYTSPKVGDGFFGAIHAGNLREAIQEEKRFRGLASDQAVDLIFQLLNVNQAERLACSEILTHPWLADDQAAVTAAAAAAGRHGAEGMGDGGQGGGEVMPLGEAGAAAPPLAAPHVLRAGTEIGWLVGSCPVRVESAEVVNGVHA